MVHLKKDTATYFKLSSKPDWSLVFHVAELLAKWESVVQFNQRIPAQIPVGVFIFYPAFSFPPYKSDKICPGQQMCPYFKSWISDVSVPMGSSLLGRASRLGLSMGSGCSSAVESVVNVVYCSRHYLRETSWGEVSYWVILRYIKVKIEMESTFPKKSQKAVKQQTVAKSWLNGAKLAFSSHLRLLHLKVSSLKPKFTKNIVWCKTIRCHFTTTFKASP